MSATPDYKLYTLAELEDALLHVDREKFPERVTEIQNELENRQASGDVESQFAPTPLRWVKWINEKLAANAD